MARDGVYACRKKDLLRCDSGLIGVFQSGLLALYTVVMAFVLFASPAVLPQVSAPVEALHVNSSLDPNMIEKHIAWWSKGRQELPPLTVFQHLDDFQPLLAESLWVKQAPAVLWLYFALDADVSHDLILEFLESSIDVITVFKIIRSRENQIEVHAEETLGLRYQNFKNDSDSPYHHFHLNLEPSIYQGYLVRIYSEQPRMLDVKLWQEDEFLRAGRQRALQQGIVSGISGFMVLLATVLWLVIGSHHYLGYVGFGISTAILQLIFSGFALVWLWPDRPHWRTTVEVFALLGMGMSLIPLLSLFIEDGSKRMRMLSLLTVSLLGFILLVGLLLSLRTLQFFMISYAVVLGMMAVCIAGVCKKTISRSSPVLFLIAWTTAVIAVSTELMQESPLFVIPAHYEMHFLLLASQAVMFFAILVNLIKRIRYREKCHLEQIQNLTVKSKTLKKESKLKDSFLRLISQELRNPLIGVIGGMDLLKFTQLTPKQRQHWAMVNQSSEQLHSLVNELLNFAEMQNQGISLKQEEIDFSDVLAKLGRKYQLLCEQKGIAWGLVQDKGVPDYIMGDRDRLVQLICHLLDNALKFTFYGKIELRIRIPKVMGYVGPVQLGIEVIDTGVGIPSERIPYLFDPYELSEQMDRRQFNGIGLGLPYCKYICDALNGRIEVDSQSGQGTKVTAWIMVEQTKELQLKSDRKPCSDKALNEYETLLVLLVEDNLVNQIIMTALLSRMNLTVHCADNGEQALEVLRNSTQEQARTFDMILMDCQMPIMDGYATTQAIRASSEYYSQIPIIAVTANVTPESKTHCLDAGMDDYITKPFGLELLEKRLKPWIEKLVIQKSSILKNASGEH